MSWYYNEIRTSIKLNGKLNQIQENFTTITKKPFQFLSFKDSINSK